MQAVALELARYFARCLAWADSHCWQCEAERDYETQPICPHCGAESTPF